MGSSSSGRRRSEKKTTVEEVFTISITGLVDCGIIQTGRSVAGVLKCGLSCDSDTVDAENAWLEIYGNRRGRKLHCRIRLEATVPNFGGFRWWFVCPLSKRRATTLHLPPGKDCFAHRDAHDLTYRSCQESGQWRSAMWRRIAENKGLTESAMRGYLKRWG